MAYTVGAFSGFYRYFQVEDLGVSNAVDGQYLNGDTNANYLLQTSPATGPGSIPVGNLLRGNVVWEDPALTVGTAALNASNPAVRRFLKDGAGTLFPARANIGLVFGTDNLAYFQKYDGIPTGRPVSVIRGRFSALLDANSFVSGQSPTAIGQLVYPAPGSTAVTQGLMTTTASGGTVGAGTANIVLGQVIGFETVTVEGGLGAQVSATFSGSNPTGTGTAVLVGGATVVRVQFDIPYIGYA